MVQKPIKQLVIGGKGAKKKDLKDAGLPVNWVKLPSQRKGYNV
jgi:hypothetical protein